MPVLDKKMFLRDLEIKLGAFVPANDIQQILTTAGEVLIDYEMTVAKETGADADSEDLLQYFLEAKRVEGRSESTIELYGRRIRRLKDFAKVSIAKMTVFHIRSYFSAEEKRGIKASTRENDRQIFSSFFGWLTRESLIEKNPMLNVAPVKQKKVKRKPFTAIEMTKLRRAALDPKSSRNMAIILFFASTGCRVSEVCGLNRDDIDMKEQCVTVLGKGDKERKVWFDDAAALYLSSYLAEREDEEEALFITKFRKRMQPGGVRGMMKELEKKSGVPNVHPHRFRRTRATTLIDHGMQIQNVSHLLGHEKIDTTMDYVYIDEQNVANDFRKYA